MNIGTTSTQILAADEARQNKTVVIQNTGTVDVSLGIGAANVAALTDDVGVLLKAGASVELTWNHAAAPISGIVASGTGVVRVNTI